MLTAFLFRWLGLSPEKEGQLSAWAERPGKSLLELDIERLKAAKDNEFVHISSNLCALRGLR